MSSGLRIQTQVLLAPRPTLAAHTPDRGLTRFPDTDADLLQGWEVGKQCKHGLPGTMSVAPLSPRLHLLGHRPARPG